MDVVREESERQRKQDEEDDPRQPSEQERIEHEMTHLPFRSRCKHCIKGSQVRKRHVPEIHVDCMFMGAFWVASNVVQRDWRIDLPKADGVAAWDRVGVRGHHCEV